MTAVAFLASILAFLITGTAAAGQAAGALPACDPSNAELPRLSLLTVQTGRLAPGQSACLEFTLQQGEFTRIAIAAEHGYVRGRVLGPRRDPLQVTWASSFATAAPSLPLAIEAPESGRYRLEVSVPAWVSFTAPQSFRVQMLAWESAAARAARRRDLRQDERVGWLREHAHVLRSIDPGEEDFGDLEFLRGVLGGVRVVLLGEGESGGGSDVLAKTRLVRFLHERMGFDVLAFQAGMHSSTAAWRGLQTEMDPRDALLNAVFGLLARSAQAETLVRYLRARARTDRPLEVVGFDSQFTGTAAATLLPELQAFLATRGIVSPFADAQALPTRVLAGTIGGQYGSGRPLPSLDDQSQAVAALRATALDLARRAPDRDGARWAQVLRSTAVQIELALNSARGAGAADYMRGLVRQMSDNLLWLVNEGYRDRRIIVWSHTLHAMRNPDATSHTRRLAHTAGHGVWEALGSQSFAIGLTSYAGRSHWVTGADDYYQDLIPGQHPSADFESLMEAAGHQIAMVDLRAARARGDWLGGRFVASPLYLVPEEAEWSSALDALLFIRTQEPRRKAQ